MTCLHVPVYLSLFNAVVLSWWILFNFIAHFLLFRPSATSCLLLLFFFPLFLFYMEYIFSSYLFLTDTQFFFFFLFFHFFSCLFLVFTDSFNLRRKIRERKRIKFHFVYFTWEIRSLGIDNWHKKIWKLSERNFHN